MYLFCFVFFNLQLVCEEVNVDRFYPVLYPKVSPSLNQVFQMSRSEALSTSSRWRNTVLTQNFWCSDQASRLIVTFDEHVISNNFKFGVIYQKFGQVSEVPMISLLGDLKSGSRSKKYVNFFLLLPPCRLQKKNCLGTWKKVPPLLSSWSFWVTGLTFMTLKGLVAVHLSFSFLLNLCQSTPS